MMVTIENKEIRLNSRMEELSFSKTNYDAVVTQKGLLAKAKNNSEGIMDWTFADWTFSDIKSFDVEGNKNRLVFYCGENPLSNKAKTLLELSETKDFLAAGYAVCSIITQAAQENITIPLIGAGGILVDITAAETSVLFLAEDSFKYSVGGLPEQDYSSLHAHWLNSTIYDLPGMCFMRSVIAYRMVSGKMPYPAINQLERNADFLDSKFLPVDYCCKNLNSKLAININKGLKLNANLVNIPGKKKKGKSSEDLTPTADFPLEELFEFSKNPEKYAMSQEEFNEKNAAFLKKQDSQIALKRKIRRNKTAIICAVLGVFVAALVIRATIKSSLENYTSKGLTSVETIEGYYKAVNIKDSVMLDIFTKGGNTSSYNDIVSNIYVVGKMQQQYSNSKGYLSPGRWALEAANESGYSKATVYGVTGLIIDGKPEEIDTDIAQRLDNPPAIKFDNNKEVHDKDVVNHSVEYNLIFTEGADGELTISHLKGSVELTFVKDRWRITNFNLEETPMEIDNEQFKQDYFNSLAETDNARQTVNSLREKYPWLPSDVDMDLGLEEIEQANALLDEFTPKSMQPAQ